MFKITIPIISIVLLAAPVNAGTGARGKETLSAQKEEATSASVWSFPLALGLTLVAGVTALIRHCLKVPKPPLGTGRPPSVPRLEIPRAAPFIPGMGSQAGGVVRLSAREENTTPLRILIIDDDQMVTMSPRRILGRVLGNEVIWVQDAQAALEVVTTQDFDLILMDHHMPHMNGLEMTRLLRDEGIETTIVSHSTELPEESRADYKELGVTEFFDKSKPREEAYRDLLARLSRFD